MASNNAIRRFAGEPPLGPDIATTTPAHRASRERQLLRFDQFQEHYTKGAAQAARDERPQWLAPVRNTLLKYTELPQGWDSYSGQPLRSDVLVFALTMLNSVMQAKTPLPHLVPSSEGGLQIEWHEKGIDLEVYIAAPYRCEMWFEDHREGRRVSVELSNDFTALIDPIAKVTLR
jgi:hypothetical protein